MDLWHGQVLYRGELRDREDFHTLQAAKAWAEQRLTEIDSSVPVVWRQVDDRWEAGPSPDFCARLLVKG